MDIQSGKATEVNCHATPFNFGDGTGEKTNTVINPAALSVTGSCTEVNPSALPVSEERSTSQRTGASPGAEKNLGLVIEGYTLVSVMATTSGEADLYVCVDKAGKRYCLKHYKRLDSVSAEVHASLQNLNAENVAKLISWGYWDERIYEVWPLFANGSLVGQHPDAYTLKKYIRQMNGAIWAIHQHGFIHQDIKPANFMIDDNGDIALIDFGTCTIISNDTDRRTHVTKIGQTTDYASPEVLFSKYCWPASDYYSLGVTIYELLLGTTPYAYYDENMLQRKIDDMRDARIPNLDRLSKEYQDLVTGLLWYEKDARWGYVQICDWLNGDYKKWNRSVSPSHPGLSHEKQFRFDGTAYQIPSQFPQLIVNMAYRWELGKNLFDEEGRFIRMCKTLEDMEGTEELYALCNAPKSTRNEDANINYFRKLYQLSPELKLFAWRNWHFQNKKALGEAILRSLWASEIDAATGGVHSSESIFDTNFAEADFPSMDEIRFWARNHIISQYLSFIDDRSIINTISELENYAQNDTLACFQIAYKLSGSTELRLPSGQFSDKAEFLRFVEKKAQESDSAGSIDAFLQFCRSEIYDGQKINAGFQAWVESLGLEGTLKILTDDNCAQQVIARQEAQTKTRMVTPRADKTGQPINVFHTGAKISGSKYATLICPVCGGRFSYPNASGDTTARCPYCGSNVPIT